MFPVLLDTGTTSVRRPMGRRGLFGVESTQALPSAPSQKTGGAWLTPGRPCPVWGWFLGVPASDEVAPDDLECSVQH